MPIRTPYHGLLDVPMMSEEDSTSLDDSAMDDCSFHVQIFFSLSISFLILCLTFSKPCHSLDKKQGNC